MRQKKGDRNPLLIGVLALSLPLFSGRADQQQPPSDAQARIYLQFGITNGMRGDYDGAISAFNQALRIDPNFAPAYYNRGFAQVARKDTAAAMSDFNHVIQIDPSYSDAYFQRGCLEGQAANFDAAKSDFKETIKLNPTNAMACYNLGHVYYFEGELDDAFEQLNQGLKLQSDFAPAYFIRGLIRRAQGHRTESQADFLKGVGLNFPYAAFWYWISENENGQHGLAHQDLENCLANPEIFKPDDWPSQIGNFLLEKITQDQLVALAGQGDATGAKERLCEAWFYAGMVRHFAGDDKGAQDCFEHAAATGSASSEEYVEANRQITK